MTLVFTYGIERGDIVTIPAGERVYDHRRGTWWQPCKPRRAEVTSVNGPVAHLQAHTALGNKVCLIIACPTVAGWKG